MRKANRNLIMLAAAICLVGCNKQMMSATTTPGTVKTEPTSAEVVRQDLTGYIFFDGKVDTPPGVQAVVYSPYELAVNEVLTSVGKRVGRGETIVRLSIPNAKVALDQAEANLQIAQSTYAASKAQYDGPVRDAQRMLGEARAAEKAARTDVQNGGSSDLAGATEARVAAEQALRIAQADVNSRMLPEKQALDMANEYLKDARAGARQGNVKAPITGTVVSLQAKPGMQARSKEPLATIVDLRALRIQGTVPPEHSELVKRGTKILIALDGPNSDPFEGEVREISILPPAEGQKSAGYLAVIDFGNDKGLVQPGTVIKRLGVRTGKVEKALVVPVAAVAKDENGKLVVYVQKGSEWVVTPVETGISDGALIEIKSGLSEGDAVRVNSVTIAP